MPIRTETRGNGLSSKGWPARRSRIVVKATRNSFTALPSVEFSWTTVLFVLLRMR